MTFTERVKEVVKNIPAGSVMTYREVASASGNPKAYRAVASMMANNYDLDIPCHRVIRTDGKPGGYNRGGERAKIKLLASEGAIIDSKYVYLQN